MEVNARFPTVVTPSSTTTFTTLAFRASHGAGSFSVYSAIAPVPLTVSTPLSSNTQVRFSPQVPLVGPTPSAEAARAASRTRLVTRISMINIQRFIKRPPCRRTRHRGPRVP